MNFSETFSEISEVKVSPLKFPNTTSLPGIAVIGPLLTRCTDERVCITSSADVVGRQSDRGFNLI
jgi:hypothetical protein